MFVKWKLISVHLEIVLISAEGRCTVCAECTTGKVGARFAPSDLGQVEAHFGPFGDSTNI
jgi:hypothetical protein